MEIQLKTMGINLLPEVTSNVLLITINYMHFHFFHLISVPPRYDPVFRLSPPPSAYTFPCLIDPSEGAFEAFDIKPK